MDVSYDGELGALENARRDDALLRRGVAAARTAVLDDRAVSIGVGQSFEAPAALAARRLGILVHRRASGGTGLLHLPGDVVWSLVLPRADPRAGRDDVAAYARFGRPLSDHLRDLGLAALWGGPLDRSDQHCLLGARGEVLLIDGKAVGGAAQHLTGSSLLHHGAVDVNLERALVRSLFDLEDSAVALLGSLRDAGLRVSSTELAAGLADALQRF